MDLDKFIEYLVVTDQVDSNFQLKEKCPKCNNNLETTNDNAFPFYCPNCDMFINRKKTEGTIKPKK